ncbi:carboxymuconolactone decarboxylase family protein [bacterium]|jgi:uncharacterized peroxidase-related enzyme|nr:carboxymuconolactone decarboxylase family protein [Verrucomicrobiota bacterium]MDA7633701.1 carboxymuconolactone decarboxylase family protein [bacterium]MDA7667395.1 carboxymuconolactone decarboxylase family protein [bacterium]
MNRITQIDPSTATGKTRELFSAVQSKLGKVPNVFRVLGNSPAALSGYLNFNSSLADGFLDAKVREQIALAVAETNLCNYCLSAHSTIGCQIGLSDQDVADARRASSTTTKTDAILKFTRSVVVNRGELSDEELKEAKAAGLSEGEIVEIVANVASNILTNYVNHIARTVVDFPKVQTGDIEAAIQACSHECACSH